MPELYRIERIVRQNIELQNEEEYRHIVHANNAQIILEKIPQNIIDENLNEDLYLDSFETLELSSNELKLNTGTKLYEGMFVYYDMESHAFSSGRNDKRAQLLIQDNKRYRENILYRSADYNAQNDENNLWFSNGNKDVNITSYHVNVGHGNCSIILIQREQRYQIWMIDCGMYDYRIHQSYICNIAKAFRAIANKLHIDVVDVKINRFYLTHWHFDHYSGLLYLIQSKKIDSSTIFCMNLYYAVSSCHINKILQSLVRLKVICVEPTSTLRLLSNTSILHPECRIRRWKKVGAKERVVRNINDSSVVYAINLAGKCMVLPGDIEQKGIKQMLSVHTCSKDLWRSEYFCVPHHASATGDMRVLCPRSRTYAAMCVQHNLSFAIVMGRNGAFPGIYDQSIIRSFTHPVLFSEYDSAKNIHSGIEIDWGTNSVQSI